jgi:hypothetical protein
MTAEIDITVRCPNCGRALDVKRRQLGTAHRCPGCHEQIVLAEPRPADLYPPSKAPAASPAPKPRAVSAVPPPPAKPAPAPQEEEVDWSSQPDPSSRRYAAATRATPSSPHPVPMAKVAPPPPVARADAAMSLPPAPEPTAAPLDPGVKRFPAFFRPKTYPALNLLAFIYKVLAVLVAAGACVWAVIIAIGGVYAGNGTALLMALGSAAISLVMGFLSAVTLYAIGEGILMLLDLARNTEEIAFHSRRHAP